jgi:complex III assembly factor LYRM7
VHRLLSRVPYFCLAPSTSPASPFNVARDGPSRIPKPAALCAHRFPRWAHTSCRYAQSTHTRPGDLNVLVAARAEVRKNFEADRHLQAGSDDISKKITHAQEVAKFLRENVVQGEATDDAGNYSTRQSPTPLNGMLLTCIVELRIHEDTERGDNEDIKKAKGKRTIGGAKCCSS